MVLAVWTSAKSAKTILCQDTSSGLRVKHAVSKALGRHLHWHVCQRKPTISGLNPQYLPRILLGSLLSIPSL
jgi:hypothetical protein